VGFPLPEPVCTIKNLKFCVLCGAFLVQITLLAENGGENVTEFCKRNMKFFFSPQLARLYNLSGQWDKYAFKPLELFNVMFGRYSLFSLSVLHCFAYNDRGMYLSCTACALQALALNDTSHYLLLLAYISLNYQFSGKNMRTGG